MMRILKAKEWTPLRKALLHLAIAVAIIALMSATIIAPEPFLATLSIADPLSDLWPNLWVWVLSPALGGLYLYAFKWSGKRWPSHQPEVKILRLMLLWWGSLGLVVGCLWVLVFCSWAISGTS